MVSYDVPHGVRLFVLFVSAVCVLVGCVSSQGITKCGGSKKVARMPCGESQTTDQSGRWNETDARNVADPMIGSMLESTWLQVWKQEHDEPPALAIGPIRNRNNSRQEYDETGFIKEVARSLVNSDRVQFVEASELRRSLRRERDNMCCNPNGPTAVDLARGIGADFVVVGTFHSSVSDSLDGGRTSIFYTVNLELIDSENKTKVWINEKEIKKIVEVNQESH